MNQVDMVRQLVVDAGLTTSQLPYTEKFERLKNDCQMRLSSRMTDSEFWRLLVRVGKRGGLARGKSRKTTVRSPKLTTEQQLELLRLLPDGIGSRDQLPYTEEFESLHRHQRGRGKRRVKPDWNSE